VSGAIRTRAGWTVWRVLLMAQLREQPGRLLVTVIAIALGVALGTSVYLVNSAALNEFGLATKRLVGEADIIVRGPREGFPEALYTTLARDSSVGVASPVLELEVALPGRRDTLKVLGLDPFRAAALQPALFGDIAGGIFDLFKPDGIFLSNSAAQQLNLKRGDSLPVLVGSAIKTLHVLGVLSEATYPQALGVMDIASAQWAFDKLGSLNRIDLRLRAGTSVQEFRTTLGRRLPSGVLAVAPQVERDRAVTVTRAYRVNLNMLALVALWTGAFLVFSTQSLSVLRRRRSLALLRALGVTRGELERALVGEGAALGAVGSLLGLALGALLAAAILSVLTGDLGNGQMRAVGASVSAAALPMLLFFLIGTGVASVGAWFPARAAARQPPARALKGGDADYNDVATKSWQLGVALLSGGGLLAWLPPVGGLPIFGYASIGALLFGAVLLVPILTVRILKIAPRTNRVVLDTAMAQLRENVGLSTLSLASIIVSFSLMVAMAIMVYSFRVSFEHWLGKLLPADVQLREPQGNDTAYWSPEVQRRLATVPGISRFEFRHTQQILLDAARPAVTLIARGADAAQAAGELPLVKGGAPAAPAAARGAPRDAAAATARLPPAWISEALQDLYGLEVGGVIALPLGGETRRFQIAGVWRDYARTFGAVVIPWPAYVEATGDHTATEGSAWLDGSRGMPEVEAALRAVFVRGDAAEIMASTSVRDRSLQIFDRAFAITYALEAIAVIIGLTGVSFAASSTALARRAEFGMLRHIGMLRKQVIGILASEGCIMSVFGVLYGLSLGVVLSLVLVYVVNRQSFNWSIDLAVPAWQLGALSITLIGAAALTALWSGRAATSQDAVRAVREDW
jgi:putative ABC transport system permease protein